MINTFNAIDNKDLLILKLKEYITFISEELDETVTIATIHGWKSSRYEEGEKRRLEIEEIENGCCKNL